MKKCLPISLLVSLLCFGAAGCNFSTPSSSSNTPTSNSSSEVGIKVEKVSIEYDGETTVLAGTTAKLTAKVTGEGDKKVTWTSSNDSVAKVVNGSVSFRNVAEDTTVTITATSKDDATKSDSIEFTVKYTEFNFANSKGSYDASLYLDEGIVEVEPGDSALLFNGVYGTRWYVEATFATTGFKEGDDYPKFGIMTGDSADGNWNAECKQLFFGLFADMPTTNNAWSHFGFIGQNDTYSDWNWGNVVGADATSAAKKGENYRMALHRDGTHYYLYAGAGEDFKLIKHVVNEAFAADEATYAWFGGWATGYTLSNPVILVDDEINSKYTDITEINLDVTEGKLYLNESYQLDYTFDSSMYNPSKLKFTSSDEGVATVNENGLITAGNTAGTATITVSYGELSKEFALEVTADEAYRVSLDGKADEGLWSEQVMATGVYRKHGSYQHETTVYATRNYQGIYFYVEQSSAEDFSANGSWWQADNIEFRIVGNRGIIQSQAAGDQHYASTYNRNTNTFTNGYVGVPTLNEETGLYDLTYELFVSYRDLGVTNTANLAFGFGTNPGGAHWYCEDDWANSNVNRMNKITANGVIARGTAYTPDTCTEHKYTNWTVAEQVTCKKDGLLKAVCDVCGGHEVSKVVPTTGEHVWNSEAQQVSKVATCCEEGLAGAPCYGYDECGAVNESIVLPKDQNNHSAWDAEKGICTDCHSSIEHFITLDHWDRGGWDADRQYFAMDLAGDFKVTTEFTLQTNGIPNNWWRGALPIVQHALGDGRIDGSVWVTRFDWWGWCDQWSSADKLTQDWNHDGDIHKNFLNRDDLWSNADGANVSGEQFETSMTNGRFVWTCTRTGTVILNEFVITSDAGTFTFWSKATDVAVEKNINLAMGAEFAKYTIEKVVIEK